MRKKLLIFFICLTVVLPVSACSKPMNKIVIPAGTFAYGTITMYAELYSTQDITGVDIAIVDAMRELDLAVNTTNNQSEIYEFNNSTSTDYMEIGRIFYDLLEISKEHYEVTEYYFNPAIYPLVVLWGMSSEDINDFEYHGDLYQPPTMPEVEYFLQFCDFDDIELKEHDGKYFVKKAYPEMMLDFGAVAKGYSADLAASIAREYGVEHALINISGNTILIGYHPEGRDWYLSFEAPRYDLRDQRIFAAQLNNVSAVASADNHRFYIKQGVRYAHIIDPIRGMPLNVYVGEDGQYTNINPETNAYDGAITTIIINQSSTLCDIYSTAPILMGIERGSQFLAERGLVGVIGTEDRRMSVIGEIKRLDAAGYRAYLDYSFEGFTSYGRFI